MDRRGLAAMDPEAAFEALHDALTHGETALTVADVDWERFYPAFAMARPRPLLHDIPAVAALLAEERDGDGDMRARSDLAERLVALPAEEQQRTVLGLVRTHVAAVLGHSGPEGVQAGRSFRDLGFDSLTAVELRNRLSSATGVALPATLIFDYPNPNAIVEHLRRQLCGGEATFASALASVSDLEQEAEKAVVRFQGDPEQVDLAEITPVISRLKAVLAQYESLRASSTGTSGASSASSDLSSATASELIDIINQEFGSVSE
ncbi:hypothetical protein FQU76_30165 [Streptomyces qinzhouensis]|uniref:Carrier domain-containing protein n=2 Tax=Streptomyces qinzhouensis TaxID=2599401 RepID=A0A5B8JTX3_9ACTN|nr:hypothetical protein FQU76_30165 [Streptomyces qinzhouensis]